MNNIKIINTKQAKVIYNCNNTKENFFLKQMQPLEEKIIGMYTICFVSAVTWLFNYRREI